MTLQRTATFVADKHEGKPVVIDTFENKYMPVQGRVSAQTLAKWLNEGHQTRIGYVWRDFWFAVAEYPQGTKVTDPETGYGYTYEGDGVFSDENGESYSLAGVAEVVAS